MTPVEEQPIIDACSRLFINYARFVDFGDYGQFVELFTENAILSLGFDLHGKEKIRRSMTRRPADLRSRHVLSNISIDVIDDAHASGIAYLTLYRHIGPESLDDAAIQMHGPAGVGHYSNRFERTASGWRIASCQLAFAFKDPSQFP